MRSPQSYGSRLPLLIVAYYSHTVLYREGQRPADWSPLNPPEKRGVIDDSAAAMAAVKAVPMQAGQVLLLHCHTLHGSQGNATRGDRRMLFCRYADADAVEVYNEGAVRVGRLLRGESVHEQVTTAADDTR